MNERIYVGTVAGHGKLFLEFDNKADYTLWVTRFENGDLFNFDIHMTPLANLVRAGSLMSPYSLSQLNVVDELIARLTNDMLKDIRKVKDLNDFYPIYSKITPEIDALIEAIKKESTARIKLIFGIKDSGDEVKYD